MSDGAKLYRHFDADDVLLYVGISLNAVARLSGHKTRSDWSGDIARVEIEGFENRAAAKVAEEMAIRNEKPIFNIQHNGRRRIGGKIMTDTNECRRVRAALGLTQEQMAEALGLSQSYYSRLETGAKTMTKRHKLALQAIEAKPPKTNADQP